MFKRSLIVGVFVIVAAPAVVKAAGNSSPPAGAPGAQTVPTGAAGSVAGSGAMSVSASAARAATTAPSAPVQAATAAEAATASLPIFAQLQSARTGSPPPSTSSRPPKLGKPLTRTMIHLSAVTGYTDGQDPRTALFDKKEVLYPILSDSGVLSSVAVRQRQNGKWEPAIFGAENLMRDVEAVRAAITATTPQADASMLIDVPTLKARLLVVSPGANMTVAPIHDVPGTSLRSGVVYPLADVLKALRPVATAIGGGNQ